MTARATATQFKVSISTVNRIVNRHGGRVRSEPPSDALITHAAARYEAGETVRELSESLGVAKSTLQRALKDAGVVMRAPAPRVAVSREGD